MKDLINLVNRGFLLSYALYLGNVVYILLCFFFFFFLLRGILLLEHSGQWGLHILGQSGIVPPDREQPSI